VRSARNADAVRTSLTRLQDGARSGGNVMPRLVDAVRAYATIGEMCDALRQVWGEYEEIPVI
jgi:methylmalonyl-CoA mutase N-terminal domain/subunit